MFLTSGLRWRLPVQMPSRLWSCERQRQVRADGEDGAHFPGDQRWRQATGFQQHRVGFKKIFSKIKNAPIETMK
jgi:hypothetical protein